MAWVERVQTNLKRVMAKAANDIDGDPLDFYRARLEQYARSGDTPPPGAVVPPQRRLPPPASAGETPPRPQLDEADKPVLFDGESLSPIDGESLSPIDGESLSAGPDPMASDTAAAAPSVQPTGRPGSTASGASVPAKARGFGTFAVLEPKVQRTRVPRVGVRSLPRSEESRSEAAEERRSVRSQRPTSIALVRTNGGFVVPGPPAVVKLPDVPLPPAPTPLRSRVTPS